MSFFCLQTNMVYHCDAAECTPHNSKIKKQHLSLHGWRDVTDLYTQWRWKALRLGMRRRTKTRKNVNVLNLIRNSRPCSRHFNKEKMWSWVAMLSALPGTAGPESPRWGRVLPLTRHVPQYSDSLYCSKSHDKSDIYNYISVLLITTLLSRKASRKHKKKRKKKSAKQAFGCTMTSS